MTTTSTSQSPPKPEVFLLGLKQGPDPVSATATAPAPAPYDYAHTLAEALDKLEQMLGTKNHMLFDAGRQPHQNMPTTRKMFQVVRRLYLDPRFTTVFESYAFIQIFQHLLAMLRVYTEKRENIHDVYPGTHLRRN